MPDLADPRALVAPTVTMLRRAGASEADAVADLLDAIAGSADLDDGDAVEARDAAVWSLDELIDWADAAKTHLAVPAMTRDEVVAKNLRRR